MLKYKPHPRVCSSERCFLLCKAQYKPHNNEQQAEESVAGTAKPKYLSEAKLNEAFAVIRESFLLCSAQYKPHTKRTAGRRKQR